MRTKFNLPLAIALAAALSASPLVAQGNSGKGNGNGRGNQQEQRDRDRVRDNDDDDDDDRDEDRPRFERRRTDDRRAAPRRSTVTQTGTRRVPPGWCRGQGNPHNTAENCRWNNSRNTWERYDSRTGRWETRSGDTRYGDRGSYQQAHQEFHYSHDRQCRERAAQRPLDLRWQVQVRTECRNIHEDFHRRWGTAHR